MRGLSCTRSREHIRLLAITRCACASKARRFVGFPVGPCAERPLPCRHARDRCRFRRHSAAAAAAAMRCARTSTAARHGAALLCTLEYGAHCTACAVVVRSVQREYRPSRQRPCAPDLGSCRLSRAWRWARSSKPPRASQQTLIAHPAAPNAHRRARVGATVLRRPSEVVSLPRGRHTHTTHLHTHTHTHTYAHTYHTTAAAARVPPSLPRARTFRITCARRSARGHSLLPAGRRLGPVPLRCPDVLAGARYRLPPLQRVNFVCPGAAATEPHAGTAANPHSPQSPYSCTATPTGRDNHAAASGSAAEPGSDTAAASWLRARKKDSGSSLRPAPAGAASASAALTAAAVENLASGGGSWLRTSRAPKPAGAGRGHERYAGAQCVSSAETRTSASAPSDSDSIESFL